MRSPFLPLHPRALGALSTTLLLCLAGASGCGTDVMVGEGNGGTGGASAGNGAAGETGSCNASGGSGDLGTVDPSATPDTCGTGDAPRAAYEEWETSENQLEGLLGTVWEGYVDAGPDLRFTIDDAGNALLHIGDGEVAPEPVKDQGYLCDATQETHGCQIEGWPGVGDYVIRGAEFSQPRLEFTVPTHGRNDAWCALQTSYFHPGSAIPCVGCSFLPYPSGERTQIYEESGSTCAIGEEDVDCQWLSLITSCACDATGCFMRAPGGVRIDLTLDAPDHFEGTSDGSGRLQLWLVPD